MRGNLISNQKLPEYLCGVTIGIPLYNEELFIEAAIRSAAPQCETLIVADNCSTDQSAQICEALRQEYPNLLFVRHDINLGAANNFKYVLEKSVTPYFMWLGAHDMLPPNYVQTLRRSLDSDQSAALAFGAVTHIDRSGCEVSKYEYTYASSLADDSPAIRFKAIIRYLLDCSLIHGLFRIRHLKEGWRDFSFLGVDHVLLANVVITGKYLYVPEIRLLRRDVHVSASKSAQLERITGTKLQQRVSLTMTEMQRAQYKQAVQLSCQMGRKAAFFRFSIYFWLVSRFGPIRQVTGLRLLEVVIYQLSSGVRLFHRVMARN